ncbi:MAG: CDP-alcohol phosphatidyltransferase family protein [Candidatus Limnocylindrales bacterium]
MFWGRRINEPAGAVIAILLLPTRVTPNMVSLAGLLVHVAAAMTLFVSPAPVSGPVWIFVILIWQFAFSLDCADGQLARARGRTSPFGAFFDQTIDVITHALLYTALTSYAVRALGLSSEVTALLVALVFSLSYLQLYTTWGRNAILGTEPAIRGEPPAWLRILLPGMHLLDYGFYLFVAGLLLPWPIALLGFLIGASTILGVSSLAQIGLNWHRFVVDSRARESGQRGR